jgi:TRAP-type uncharacterized transport system fused permease subunit
LLLKAPVMDVVWVGFAALAGIAASAVALGGWLWRPLAWWERALAAVAAVLLFGIGAL